MNTLIFTLIFGYGADLKRFLPVDKQPWYPVYVFAAMLPWQLFSTAMSLGATSLVNQQHLLTKVYLPRLFVPTSAVCGALVDMMISVGILGTLMAIFGVPPMPALLMLPVLMFLTLLASLGSAYTLSALTVSYRDFRFITPFLAQILMWISFVAYPVDIIGNKWWTHLLALNPMFGIISGFRSAVLDLEWRTLDLAISAVTTAFVFVFGLFYFRKTERRFADIA